MRYSRPDASVFIPDGSPVAEAMRRITHLGIGAHADDLEIMAYHGILESRREPECWFGGVTCTDGSRAPRRGAYEKMTDPQMRDLRRQEQEEAARIGNYGVMIQLDHESSAVRALEAGLDSDLDQILGETSPRVIYTHNLADKHPTHVAVALAVVEGLRRLPADRRPHRLYGCEVWRGLDWMLDDDRIQLDVGGDPRLAADLIKTFETQISGSRRYDLAIAGRRKANATFLDFDCAEAASELDFAMDLTPLILDVELDPAEHVRHFLKRFSDDVTGNIERLRRSRPAEACSTGRPRYHRDS